MGSMSRLADRLRRSSRVEPAPMGFGAAAARAPAPTLLCLVRLGAGEAGKAADAASRGAAAVILEGADAGRVKELAQKVADLSLGVRPGKAERGQVAAYREAGADFVVLEPDSTPAEAILEKGIGMVLALGRDPSDTALRLVSDLSLDALALPALDGPFTMTRMLELRRLSALSRTPLLVEVAPEAGASYLQALREAGVIGVVLDGRALDRLAALKAAIASLPPRGRRREERAEALLPASVLVSPEEDDDDDDEFP